MKIQTKKINDIDIVIAGIIGFLVALLIYGITPLDVTNDKWIYNGYMEPDIIQHYAGWLNYRNSEWSFPLGKIVGLGTYCNYISFTDSIPLFAIFFKLFRVILPTTFQYFGIYVFLCFALQGIFAYKILERFIDNKIYRFLGILLFLISPVMIERAFRHTALASHWIILASIYLYFKSLDEKKLSAWYILCVSAAVLIHPYFIPMIFAFMLAYTLQHIFSKEKKSLRVLIVWICSIAACGVIGWLVGLFGWISAIHSKTIGAYGYFTTDLNSIINPVSQSYPYLIPSWSVFLPVQDYAINTMCDGFNYMGIGVLVTFPILLFFACINKNIKIKKIWGYI